MNDGNRPVDLEGRLLSSVRSAKDVSYCQKVGVTFSTFATVKTTDKESGESMPSHGEVWEYLVERKGVATDEDLKSLHDFERGEAGDLRTYVREARVAERGRQANSLMMPIASYLNEGRVSESGLDEKLTELAQGAAKLLPSAKETAPTIQLDEDGWDVLTPFCDGQIAVGFRDLIAVKEKLIADVMVRYFRVSGFPDKVLRERVDLLSNSSKDAFRRSLDRYFGKTEKDHWFTVLTDAVQLVLKEERSQNLLVDMAAVSDNTELDWLAWPLAVRDQPTILFGDGESCKTYLALYLAVCLAKGLQFMGHTLEQTNVLYVDYESGEKALKRRIKRLLAGMGQAEGDIWKRLLIYDAGAAARTFEYSVHSLRSLVRTHEVGLVIVDTAGDAAMGDLTDAAVVIRYFLNLRKLGVSTLSACHITKAGDQHTPYGSIYWRNRCRVMWNSQAKFEPDDDNVKHMKLAPRKGNEMAPLEKQWLTFHFKPPKNAGPVSVGRTLGPPSAFDEELPLRERILRQLQEGALTIEELAATLDVPMTQVKVRLYELQRGERVLHSKLTHTWRLVTPPVEDEGCEDKSL